jgi:hypothetical protein
MGLIKYHQVCVNFFLFINNKHFSFLALALDIAMKEIEQIGHDDERMVLVFNAFEQIIPQLGVFSPLAAKLRNEFFGKIDKNLCY